MGEHLPGYAIVKDEAAPDCVTGPAPLKLWRIYLGEGFIGQGLGARLMADVHAEARHRGAQTLWLGVYPAPMVRWAKDAANEPQVGRLKVGLNNESGALAEMCTVIARHGGNIVNLKITNREPLVFELMVDVEVRDVKHLANIVGALHASPSVNSVDRPHGELEAETHDA